MKTNPPKPAQNPGDTLPNEEEVLRRMLNTPPQPFKRKAKPVTNRVKKPTK